MALGSITRQLSLVLSDIHNNFPDLGIRLEKAGRLLDLIECEGARNEGLQLT